MAFRRSILLLLLFLLLSHCFFVTPISAGPNEEEFSEELLLKPLPDRKVLAHFHFDSRAPPTKIYGRHHHLFPKSVYQLVHKFRIREMELSFTQGRWNYERWGGFDPMSSGNAKPPGVELWAVFDVPLNEVDAMWKNLTHALSGLFCASINFLESSTAYSAPDWGFRDYSGTLRYGALPREAVCTENLTPWLKLLPCRDKAGLAALMDRPSIYRGFYHSQRLRIISAEFGLEEWVESETGLLLEQALTVVLQPSVGRSSPAYSNERLLQPSWSISSVFGRKVAGQCALAKNSKVFLEIDKGLIAELEKLGAEDVRFGDDGVLSKDFWRSPAFELPVIPDAQIKEANILHGKQSSAVLYEFSVEKYSDYDLLDVGIKWKLPVVWSCIQAPFHASRFLMGSGNERGSITISLESTGSYERLMGGEVASLLLNEDKCTVRVVVFQVVPWYVKVYFHTLQIFINGQLRKVKEVVEKMHVSPSEDKVSPGVTEMVLNFPCNMNSAAITFEFDKGFLHIDEYPPDANQGFDVPAAVISFPDFRASSYFLKENSSKSPLLFKLQEKNIGQAYTEVLLVPLTTPDFSMPYNVITFTCTVLALYFGSLLNTLRRRIGEEERLFKSKAALKVGLIPRLLSELLAKLRGRPPQEPPKFSSSSLVAPKLLFKIILVAVIAAGWHYYLSDH